MSFFPAMMGSLKMEGLEVEENGRLVQRDVTQHLLSTRVLERVGPVVKFT